MIKIQLIKNCKVHPMIPWLPKGKILNAEEIVFGDAIVQFQCYKVRIHQENYKIVDLILGNTNYSSYLCNYE